MELTQHSLSLGLLSKWCEHLVLHVLKEQATLFSSGFIANMCSATIPGNRVSIGNNVLLLLSWLSNMKKKHQYTEWSVKKLEEEMEYKLGFSSLVMEKSGYFCAKTKHRTKKKMHWHEKSKNKKRLQ